MTETPWYQEYADLVAATVARYPNIEYVQTWSESSDDGYGNELPSWKPDA